MGQKRKRQHNAADTEEDVLAHPAKIRVASEDNDASKPRLEQQDKVEKGLRNQMRSERRAKKDHKAKGSGFQKKEQRQEEQDADLRVDNIAQGADFISLNGFGSEPSTEKVERRNEKKERRDRSKSKPTFSKTGRAGFKDAASHKASPRSIRLAAKEQKARNAVETEYGADMLNTSDNMAQQASKTSPRFICFVGNLPYDCTTEQLHVHFGKLAPKSIRHPTDKATGKSKGYAFLEFTDYDKMKTCLKLYHHSIFEPDRLEQKQQAAGDKAVDVVPRIADKKNRGRMINVELTVGGGGKGGARQKKIKDKNIKLEEERSRRREEEKKKAAAKDRKVKKDGAVNTSPVDVNGVADGRGDVHPSRLKRVKH